MLEMIRQHFVLILISAVLLVGLLIPCFVARYAPQIQAVFLTFIRIFCSPIEATALWLRRCLDAGRTWLRNQIASFSSDGTTDKALSYIFGALLYTGFGCLLVVSEIPLLAMTLEGWGFTGIAEKLAALSVLDDGICTVMAIILTSVVWGFLFFDALDVTHFAPFMNKLSKIGKMCMLAMCSMGFMISIVVMVAIAYYRGEIVSQSILDLMATPAQAGTSEEYNKVNKAQTSKAPDFESLAVDAASKTMPSGPDQQAATAVSLPQISSFAATLPTRVLPTTALNMVVLTGVTFSAGLPPFLLWCSYGVFAVLLVPVALGCAIFHVVLLILNCIAENILRILILVIEYGSSLLRLIGIEPTERQAASLAKNGAVLSPSQPAAPAPNQPNNPPASTEEVPAPTPPAVNGFDPFG